MEHEIFGEVTRGLPIALPPLRRQRPPNREIQARQRSAIRVAARIERATEDVIARILGEARDELRARLAEIADPDGRVDPARARGIIDEVSARTHARIQRVLSEATTQVARAGALSQVLVVDELRRVTEAPARIATEQTPEGLLRVVLRGDVPIDALFGAEAVTPELLLALEELVSTEVTSLTRRMRDRMLGAIQRSALGEGTIVDVMRQVDQLLPARRRGARVTSGVGSNAERIVRTQLARAYNSAADLSARDLAQRSNMQLTREWVAVLDNRTRASHIRAHGQRRKIGEPFVVGGHRLRFPGDPLGPPQEVINCRCRLITVVPDDVFA